MENKFVKKIKNDLYLSDSDIEILDKYEIDYLKFKSVKELMFYLENIVRNNDVEDDLEELFSLMRKYCKEKIKLIPLKESSEMAEYMNQKISILGKKYDIIISR